MLTNEYHANYLGRRDWHRTSRRLRGYSRQHIRTCPRPTLGCALSAVNLQQRQITLHLCHHPRHHYTVVSNNNYGSLWSTHLPPRNEIIKIKRSQNAPTLSILDFQRATCKLDVFRKSIVTLALS